MSACASATGVSADARSGTSSTITTRARRASIAANSTAVVGPRQLDTLRRFADAPLGMGVVRSLAVIAVAGWLGIMAFVSFGVAPRIFRALDRAVAGEAVAAILPRYYDWGLVLCGVALAGRGLPRAGDGQSGGAAWPMSSSSARTRSATAEAGSWASASHPASRIQASVSGVASMRPR